MLRQATAATATAAALLLALGSSSAFVNPGPAALFQQQPQQLQRGCSAQGQAYALFDFFGGGSKKKSSDAGAAAAVDAAAAAAPKKPPGAVIPDKGPKLPVLYNGWFDGSIVNDMASAVKAAVKDRVPFAEIICPPIPNIEELDFGTALNQRYNKEVAARLKAPENVVRKASLAYANVDWANRVAQKIGKRTLLCAFDATVPPAGVTLCKNAELVSIKSPVVAESTANDVLVALQPGTQSMWSTAGSLKSPATVIGLNAPFSLSYDIGVGGKWDQIYCVKRCTKGWVYRCYPNPYKVYLDRPDGGVELIKVYEPGVVPKLRDVSALVRQESQARGYAILNDRYLTQRL